MEEKPNLELVYAAVSTLYNNPNPTEKEQASQWLGDLQKSVHAWKVADELLHHKRDLESCYFGAQTMRTKIHHSFHELPLEAHISLRDSLLEHISQINESTNTVIVTQLGLALADLILQMPTWPHASLDLINRFTLTNLWPLLEVLTVLPEELESRAVRLGENRRIIMLEDLVQCSNTVIDFLIHCSNTYGDNWDDNIQINVKILRCFTSWVSVGAIKLNNLTENIIIERAFTILNNKSEREKSISVTGVLHDAAADCICTLLQCIEDKPNLESLETYLFNNIINLEMIYHLSVANEDQEKSINYCRIFTELGETFLEKITNNNNITINNCIADDDLDKTTTTTTTSSPTSPTHYSMKILDLILICVGHHDYEVAEITFNLWYVLSEVLYQKNDKELTKLFRPHIERLITSLCRHCQMEPDHDGLLEDGDDFKEFRLKVSDLIKDVVFIVGSSCCFRQMFMNLQMNVSSWDSSEAALFIMQAVAKIVLPTENEVVPKVVEAILILPENTHIAVKHTSVLLLGELCEWIEKHPNTLDPILNFLVCCLQENGIGGAAALALQNICTTCNHHMPRHVPILIQLLQQIDTFAITNNSIIGLIKGVSAIITCMPYNQLTDSLRELCLLQTNPLCQLIEQNIVPVRGTKSDPVLWLDRLSSVFRDICIRPNEDEFNPCKPVVLEVWPILSRTFEKYQNDLRIMERCCRTVRFMLRCVTQQICEILESLVTQILQIYTIYKHSCFLYIGSILVDEYGTNTNCINGLLDMLQAFIEPTFQLFQQENGLRNHPDTVDDFFRLCARFLQRAPVCFLKFNSLILIIQCGLMACSLDHKEANTSVMKFFYDLINTGKYGKNLPDYDERQLLVIRILNEYGQQLITNLLNACVFYLHSYMLSEVADVIVELLEFNYEETTKWLINGLNTLPKEGNGGIMCATSQQLQDIHNSIIRSDTSKSITHALKDLTRFYR